jgi:hypothetical protein
MHHQQLQIWILRLRNDWAPVFADRRGKLPFNVLIEIINYSTLIGTRTRARAKISKMIIKGLVLDLAILLSHPRIKINPIIINYQKEGKQSDLFNFSFRILINMYIFM